MGVLGYLALGAVIYFSQDQMVFVPSRYPAEVMDQRAAAQGFVPWLNDSGERIGWQSMEGDPSQVLLVFSGNGGTALVGTIFRKFCQEHPGNWKTYLMEYPGFGSREGQPSEASLTRAGVEAVDLLARDPDRRVWLLGYSLGSGTACATVRERPGAVAGLLLLTPFDSLVSVASHHYPYFAVSWFMKTRFDSAANLRAYRGPVGVIVSATDTTVPAALGRKLYDGYAGRKRLWTEPEADHDATPVLAAHWAEIVAWLEAGVPHDK